MGMHDHTTVDRLVGEVNISKGTYYYHFDSKEDLLIAVGDKLISDTCLHATLHADSGGPSCRSDVGGKARTCPSS